MVEITQLGIHEFTFKVHGQKYTFLATNKMERDGWLKAIKTECEAAQGKKEEIQGSEVYKKTLEELSMSRTRHVLRVGRRANLSAEPAVAGASVAGATAATPSKKSDERATREENGTTKSKSRSLSRGKRGSIFDNLLGKKKEEDAAKDETKDENKGETKDENKDGEAPPAETTNDGK